MGTIYLRQKRSGNYEFSNKDNYTHKFKTQKSFKEFYENNLKRRNYSGNKIIKACYSRSQTYFYDCQEVLTFIKKHRIF